jgi:putative molybdopterin biosynthesis protein
MNAVLKTAKTDHASNLISAIRRAARQEQFLEVVSAEEAYSRFTSRIDMSPGVHERVSLSASLGRVLAQDVIACTDVPPFDRANVDGFALRSADTFGASDIAPRRLRLNGEVIVCGHAPALQIEPDSATTIATGGVIPRGADAVLMVEQTEVIDQDGAPAIELRRPAGPGQFISYAGSDIARGEVVLRRKTVISSREIGMLAACGIAEVAVVHKPKVAVLSTGNELVAPGGALGPGRVYDSNGPILAAAIVEAGTGPLCT